MTKEKYWIPLLKNSLNSVKGRFSLLTSLVQTLDLTFFNKICTLKFNFVFSVQQTNYISHLSKPKTSEAPISSQGIPPYCVAAYHIYWSQRVEGLLLLGVCARSLYSAHAACHSVTCAILMRHFNSWNIDPHRVPGTHWKGVQGCAALKTPFSRSLSSSLRPPFQYVSVV